MKITDNDPPITTQGNPTSEILEEICNILGISYADVFELRAPFINSELLKPRNQVAHGERRPITKEELSEVALFVTEIMDAYKEEILKAAFNNLHLKNSL